jgi:hypothetical protein
MIMQFLKRYVLHHFWLGVAMIIEAGFLFSKQVFVWGGIYLGFGLFFLIDDILAETKDISVMKRLPSSMQEENRLKLYGAIVFVIQFGWFWYLYLTA